MAALALHQGELDVTNRPGLADGVPDPSVRKPLSDVLSGLPGPALAIIGIVVYLTLSQLVFWLNDPVQVGAGFWPAAGASLALLLLLPGRRWGWVIGGVAIAEFAGDLIHGYPLGAAALWTVGNCVEPLVGASLIRRYSSVGGSLTPLRALVGFLAYGVVAGTLAGATIGSLGTIIYVGSPAAQVWPKYIVGDALGVLVVAPVLLTWDTSAAARSWGERLALAAGSLAVTVLVFRNWNVALDVTLPYLIVPLLMWAGLRFGVRGTALVVFLVAHVANWATATGYGPFAIAGASGHAVTSLQVFLGIVVTSAFMLASLASDLTDSHEVERRLATHNAQLRAALADLERSELYVRKLEGILPICMTCKSVRSDDDKRWVPLDTYLMEADAVSLSHTYCPVCAAKLQV